MNEAEIVTITTYMQELILLALTTATGFVLAYLGGLYYFLRNAPMPMKAGAFAAFFAIFSVLIVNAGEFYIIAEAGRQSLDLMREAGMDLTLLGQSLAHPHTGAAIDDFMQYVVLGLATITILLLAFLTFFYDWSDFE